MSIKLLITITVSKTDDNGQPAGDPLYNSQSLIAADTDCPITVTIPGQSSLDVYVEAGQSGWLKFFAVSPATPSKKLTFTASDDNYTTDTFTLDQPIALWGEALAQLFKGIGGKLTELKKLTFTNDDGCPVDTTIYFVRNVAKSAPDPCPKKPS